MSMRWLELLLLLWMGMQGMERLQNATATTIAAAAHGELDLC